MKALLLGAAAAALLAGLAGCTTRLVDFTVISTKNVDWSKSAGFQRAKTRAEASDIVQMIIIVPTGIPNMKEAIDRAIEGMPGCVALVDGVISQYGWYIPLIYGQSGFIIEGTPLIDPGLSSAGLEGPRLICRLNDAGEIEERRAVSEDEYRALKETFLR
jgi:hypothetical protein